MLVTAIQLPKMPYRTMPMQLQPAWRDGITVHTDSNTYTHTGADTYADTDKHTRTHVPTSTPMYHLCGLVQPQLLRQRCFLCHFGPLHVCHLEQPLHSLPVQAKHEPLIPAQSGTVRWQ